MIFFLLHHLVHALFGVRISEERKNLFTFLLGTFLWVCLWTVVQSRSIREKWGFIGDVLNYGFVYLVVTDVFAMAVIYKNYWGNTILHETNSVTDDMPVAHEIRSVRDKEGAFYASTPREKTGPAPPQSYGNEHPSVSDDTNKEGPSSSASTSPPDQGTTTAGASTSEDQTEKPCEVNLQHIPCSS
jgi:hypothetical protein